MSACVSICPSPRLCATACLLCSGTPGVHFLNFSTCVPECQSSESSGQFPRGSVEVGAVCGFFPFEILPQISLAWIKMTWCLHSPAPRLPSRAAFGHKPITPCFSLPLFPHLPFFCLPEFSSLVFPDFGGEALPGLSVLAKSKLLNHCSSICPFIHSFPQQLQSACPQWALWSGQQMLQESRRNPHASLY